MLCKTIRFTSRSFQLLTRMFASQVIIHFNVLQDCFLHKSSLTFNAFYKTGPFTSHRSISTRIVQRGHSFHHSTRMPPSHDVIHTNASQEFPSWSRHRSLQNITGQCFLHKTSFFFPVKCSLQHWASMSTTSRSFQHSTRQFPSKVIVHFNIQQECMFTGRRSFQRFAGLIPTQIYFHTPIV